MAWLHYGLGGTAEVASGNWDGSPPTYNGVDSTEVPAQGDLYVAAIAYRGNAAFTVPSGWTQIQQLSTGNATVGSGGISSILVAYIVRGASEPSWTFTRTGGDVALGWILGYRGQAATSPLDTSSANTLGSASVTITTATITTAEDGELLIAVEAAAVADNAHTFDAVTDPATDSGNDAVAPVFKHTPIAGTWKRAWKNAVTTGADTGIAVADAIKATAGATGTVSCINGSSARHSMAVVAFKQAKTGHGLLSSRNLERLRLVA